MQKEWLFLSRVAWFALVPAASDGRKTCVSIGFGMVWINWLLRIALTCLFLKPFTAGNNEMLPFWGPPSYDEVPDRIDHGWTSIRKKTTIANTTDNAGSLADMTDTCSRPNIMHCPHNRLAAIKESSHYSFQRKHTLIYQEMDYVCFFELWELCNVPLLHWQYQSQRDVFGWNESTRRHTQRSPKKIKLVCVRVE